MLDQTHASLVQRPLFHRRHLEAQSTNATLVLSPVPHIGVPIFWMMRFHEGIRSKSHWWSCFLLKLPVLMVVAIRNTVGAEFWKFIFWGGREHSLLIYLDLCIDRDDLVLGSWHAIHRLLYGRWRLTCLPGQFEMGLRMSPKDTCLLWTLMGELERRLVDIQKKSGQMYGGSVEGLWRFSELQSYDLCWAVPYIMHGIPYTAKLPVHIWKSEPRLLPGWGLMDCRKKQAFKKLLVSESPRIQ